MPRRTVLATVTSGLTAIALSCATPAAGSASTGSDAGAATRNGTASEQMVVKQAATTRAEQRRVANYWTSERMRSAVPGDRIVADRDKSSATGAVATGKPTVVPNDKPDNPGNGNGKGNGNGGNGGETGEYYTGDGEIVDTTGKVFFTLDGTDYVCSGSSTASTNKDLVLTAGHCVNEGPGEYATNFAFVPGYDDGARPHGTFTARQLVTTSQWKNAGDFDYDVGFAVMNARNGEDLTEAVGSQSIGFNLDRGEYMYAFGYPAARPYDGSDIAWCHGEVVQDTYFGSQDQGMDCNMTGGSSGGPWLIDYSESSGVGTLNSVNSFGYRGVKDVMWGPYFGEVAQNLHSTAQGL